MSEHYSAVDARLKLGANPKGRSLDLSTPDRSDADPKDPFLAALGERTRALRLRRGLTRKGLAKSADVSERHLANVEMGVGNASVQFCASSRRRSTARSPSWSATRPRARPSG